MKGTRLKDIVIDARHPAGVGARVLREPDEGIDWWVVADPEGNEFRAFPARS